jgi:hypothetical protein
MLNIIDEFTRECLAIRINRKLNSTDVIEVLSDAIFRLCSAQLFDTVNRRCFWPGISTSTSLRAFAISIATSTASVGARRSPQNVPSSSSDDAWSESLTPLMTPSFWGMTTTPQSLSLGVARYAI